MFGAGGSSHPKKGGRNGFQVYTIHRLRGMNGNDHFE
jgi:hypothetical protein